MNEAYFIILSGGGGERLWPLSRKKKPKQFLSFLDGKSLLQNTIERIKPLAQSEERIGVTTTKNQKDLVLNTVGSKIGFVLQEPASRNTAAAILYSCFKLKEISEDPIVVFLPSDSFVQQDDRYRSYLESAIEYSLWKEKIVTIGVMPTRPATNYGYIQADCKWEDKIDCGKFYNVFKFHEKPEQTSAQRYMQQGNMFWNISVFIGRVSVFLKEFQEHSPEIFSFMQKFFKKEVEYTQIPNISFDYAVMEKSKNIIVIPCDFDWSDIGNLDVFLSLQQKLLGQGMFKIVNIDGDRNLARIKEEGTSKSKIVAFVGVSDLCLIEEEDIILVAKRSDVDKVKKVLAEIRKQSLETFL